LLVASDVRFGCGHGFVSRDSLWLRIRFGFGHSLWLGVYGSALGVLFGRLGKHCECRNARYFCDRAAFGKAGRKAEALKGQCQRVGGRRQQGVFVSFVSLGVLTVETRIDLMSLILIYTPVSAS